MKQSLTLILSVWCLILSAAWASEEAFELSPREMNQLVLKSYQKLKTFADVIKAAERRSPARAKLLRDYFQTQGVALTASVPQLRDGDNHLQLDTLKFYPSDAGLLLVVGEKSIEINEDTKPLELEEKLKTLLTEKSARKRSWSLIESAHAGDLLEAAGILGNKIAVAASLTVLEAQSIAHKMVREFQNIPRRMREKKIRENATEACEKIKRNEPVSDPEHWVAMLKKLKKEVSCVPYWESRMENSCAWFDERIDCLSTGSSEVVDSERSSVKDDAATVQPGSRKSGAASPK